MAAVLEKRSTNRDILTFFMKMVRDRVIFFIIVDTRTG